MPSKDPHPTGPSTKRSFISAPLGLSSWLKPLRSAANAAPELLQDMKCYARRMNSLSLYLSLSRSLRSFLVAPNGTAKAAPSSFLLFLTTLVVRSDVTIY